MAVTVTESRRVLKPASWKIILDTTADHDIVAFLSRDAEETFVLEELGLPEMKIASPKSKLARIVTFKAQWKAYALELRLVCDTTASLSDLEEKLLNGAWT